MVELKAQTPFGDLLPLKIGGMTVAACDMGQLTVLGAFDRAGLSEALEATHDLALPDPLRSTAKGDGAAQYRHICVGNENLGLCVQ